MHRDPSYDILLGFLAINRAIGDELREVRRLLRERGAEVKYNPNWRLQPRAPRGTPEGGQWVDGGGGGKPIDASPGKQRRPRQTPTAQDERQAAFFEPMDDNPYLWRLTEIGLLPQSPTIAEFYNLRYDLIALQSQEFSRIAVGAGVTPAELLHTLDYGSSVMAERAIGHIERIFNNPGLAGLNIVKRDEAFRRYIVNSGVRAEYQDRLFNDILHLAGFDLREYEQHQLDVGIGAQFGFLLGGGGPASTPGLVPYATSRLAEPGSVWLLGPATRGRVIEPRGVITFQRITGSSTDLAPTAWPPASRASISARRHTIDPKRFIASFAASWTASGDFEAPLTLGVRSSAIK